VDAIYQRTSRFARPEGIPCSRICYNDTHQPERMSRRQARHLPRSRTRRILLPLLTLTRRNYVADVNFAERENLACYVLQVIHATTCRRAVEEERRKRARTTRGIVSLPTDSAPSSTQADSAAPLHTLGCDSDWLYPLRTSIQRTRMEEKNPKRLAIHQGSERF
jgi:hypothetical protein